MKQYHTLVQPLHTDDRDLEEYFKSRDIGYRLGADRQEDLAEYGFSIDKEIAAHPMIGNRPLVAVYVVLLDESDLSAIKLSIPEVQIIRNRRWFDFINTVRGRFLWFLN
jgi:hypothetical protein